MRAGSRRQFLGLRQGAYRTDKKPDWPTDRQAEVLYPGRGSVWVSAPNRRSKGGRDRRYSRRVGGFGLGHSSWPCTGGVRVSERDIFSLGDAVGREPEPPASNGHTPGERRVRTQRAALWAAYGDALGWISELTDSAGLRRRTGDKPLTEPVAWRRRIGGRSGVTASLPQGCYSDDTQLRLATSRAIRSDAFDVEAFAKVELPVWLSYGLGAASLLARQRCTSPNVVRLGGATGSKGGRGRAGMVPRCASNRMYGLPVLPRRQRAICLTWFAMPFARIRTRQD